MTRTAWGRRRTSSWPRRWLHVPKPKPGMGRGLEAILAKPAPGMGGGLRAILSASEGSSAQGGGEALELALIENMARADLSPIEEAQACSALVDELGLTREEVGRRVGRSRVSVSNLMRLLELPDEAIELLQQGRLSEGHGRALLVAEDHSARRVLAIRAVEEGWSVRTAEARARDSNARAHDNGAAP